MDWMVDTRLGPELEPLAGSYSAGSPLRAIRSRKSEKARPQTADGARPRSKLRSLSAAVDSGKALIGGSLWWEKVTQKAQRKSNAALKAAMVTVSENPTAHARPATAPSPYGQATRWRRWNIRKMPFGVANYVARSDV